MSPASPNLPLPGTGSPIIRQQGLGSMYEKARRLRYGSVLRAHRLRRRESQEQVALRAHVEAGHLSHLERNTRDSRLPRLSRICKALNLSLARVFHEAEVQEGIKIVSDPITAFNPKLQELLGLMGELGHEERTRVLAMACAFAQFNSSVAAQKQKVPRRYRKKTPGQHGPER